MTRRTLASWFAACLLVATSVSRGRADAFCDGCCEHDMELFHPVDFDLNCEPIRNDCGMFFRYSRLSWAVSGERTTIGQKGLVVPSEIIFAQGPFDIGIAPVTYDVINGIQDAAPDAKFGWGNRYEFGYFKGGNGWEIGVLQGPRVTSGHVYGFQEITIPNTLPLVTQLPDQTDGITNFVPGTTPLLDSPGAGSNDLSTTRGGFGSVHVNFATPNADFLKGFNDYSINGTDGTRGPTTGGPGRVLLVTASAFVNNNGQISLQIGTATVVSGADGLPDNNSGVNGTGGLQGTFFFVFIDTNGNGIFDQGTDPVVGNGINFGDLHTFNIRFDTLAVRNQSETDGVEIMRDVDLDNSYLPVKEQSNRFNIAYGFRYFVLRDKFSWDGDSDVLGRMFQDTIAANNILGPQIRAQWTHQWNRWSLAGDGRFVFGYNATNIRQTGALGEDQVPGGLNRLNGMQPTAFAYGKQVNTFSPLAEWRLEGAYQISSALALKLGYTGLFIDNITRSSQVVKYALPDLGILPGGKQNLLINGVDVGLEAVY